jgi:hypothetical protein
VSHLRPDEGPVEALKERVCFQLGCPLACSKPLIRIPLQQAADQAPGGETDLKIGTIRGDSSGDIISSRR